MKFWKHWKRCIPCASADNVDADVELDSCSIRPPVTAVSESTFCPPRPLTANLNPPAPIFLDIPAGCTSLSITDNGLVLSVVVLPSEGPRRVEVVYGFGVVGDCGDEAGSVVEGETTTMREVATMGDAATTIGDAATTMEEAATMEEVETMEEAATMSKAAKRREAAMAAMMKKGREKRVAAVMKAERKREAEATKAADATKAAEASKAATMFFTDSEDGSVGEVGSVVSEDVGGGFFNPMFDMGSEESSSNVGSPGEDWGDLGEDGVEEIDTRKMVFADEVEEVEEEDDVGKIEEVCRKWVEGLVEGAVGVVEGRGCRVVAEMISIGLPIDHSRYEIRWTGNFRRVRNVNVQHPGDPRYHTAPRMVYFDRIVGLRDGVPIWRSTLQTLVPLDEDDPVSHYDEVRLRFSNNYYLPPSFGHFRFY